MLQHRWALLLFLAGIGQVENNEIRSKRAIQDKFNVLINLYKMKPLQQSNIFKTYSNNILYESNLVKSIISPKHDIDFYQKYQQASTTIIPKIKENIRKEASVIKPGKESHLNKDDKIIQEDRKACTQYETKNDKLYYYERNMPSDDSYNNKVLVLR